MRNILFRAEDDSARVRLQDILSTRRIRNGDNGEDALSIQAQRCQAQIKAMTYKTIAAWMGGAMVAIATGVYAYTSDQTDDIRRDIQAALNAADAHRHDDHVRVRELDVLRSTLTASMRDIGIKIDTIADEISEHEIIDKHSGAAPLPASAP